MGFEKGKERKGKEERKKKEKEKEKENGWVNSVNKKNDVRE